MRKTLALLVLYSLICVYGFSQPANDSCSTATPISIPTSGSACVTGTTVGATGTTWSTGTVCGQATWPNDVWYTFVSTGSYTVVSVTPTGSPAAQKLGIAVYTGTCNNVTGTGPYCQVSATNGGSDTILPVEPVGTTYLVEVSSFGAAGGFDFCVSSTNPPAGPGNTCGTATKLCTQAPFNLASVPNGGTSFDPSCFDFPPDAGLWYQFTVGVSGQLSWLCTPTTQPSFVGAGDGIELDWAIYDISTGCPTTANQNSRLVSCNYNYEGANSNPIGMSGTSTTIPCTAPWPGTTAGEICQPITVTAGQTYAIFINNFSAPEATGWDFNFNGSTFKMAPVDTFIAAPDTICGNSGTVNITNNSVGEIWQQWNFGDGATSLTASPGSHNYATTGTYFITLMDSSQTGCISVASQSVLITPNPTVTVQNDTVCPGSPATLTATPSVPGGTYLWSPGGQTTASITVTPAGNTTYTVTYTSPTGCSATASAAVITNNGATASVTPSADTICPGQNATLMASAGVGYLWGNAAATSSITVSPASTTTYDVTVTVSGTCTATASGTVTVLNNATATITPSTVSICPGQNTTLTASAGTGYLWSNAAVTSSVTVSPASTTTYDVTVTITGTCTATASAVVTVAPPTASITPAPAIICAGQSSTLTASAGTGYLWSNTATTSSITVSPATTTTYDVTVTISGTCTASATSSVTVNPAPPASITPAAVTICPGGTTSLFASGGIGYLWSTNVTTNPISVSPAGTTTYSVTATNVNTCTASASAVVTVSPAFTVSPNITDVLCNGGTTGGIILTTTGTTGPFVYAWNNANTTNAINNLSAGIDSVTVSDANNCSVIQYDTVTQPTALILGPPTITNIGCNGGNTGSITANPTGGTPAYSYAWIEQSNNAMFTGQTIGNLAADNYGLQVTDGHGCQAVAAYTITTIPPLLFTPSSTNITCAGFANGTALVTLTSGTPPFTYDWSGTGTADDSTMTAIPPGAVSVVVTDANNCTGYAGFNITQPQQIYVEEVSQTNVLCNGGNNGRITAFAYGGTGTLFPLWSNGPGGYTDSNLVAGNYTITVTDSNLCTASLTETITQPAAINLQLDSQEALCYGGADGYAWALSMGGVSPYNYSWSNGAQSDTSQGLSTNGSPYYCTVTDANGCTATASVGVSQPTPIYIDPTATAVKCAGQKNGTIAVADTGGTPPYSYSATTDGFNFIYSTDSLIEGVDTGWYTVLVEDGNGCTKETQVYVPNAIPDNFNVSTDSTLCYGPDYNDGAITVIPTVIFNAPYQFSLDQGIYQPTGVYYGVSAGNHTVMVTNGNQCMDTIPVVVYEPLPVVAEVTPDTVILEPGQNKQVTVSYLNAGNNVAFSWTPAIGLSCIDCPNPTINTYQPGVYTVTVSTVNDSAVCYGSATLWVEIQGHPPVFIPDAFSPNGDGNNDVFMIYGESVKTVNMRIFNRWGELVYETENQYNGWDGMYKGQIQPMGVYVYEATIVFLDNSQTQKNGSFTLIR